jgi:hypothetical protein
MGVRCRVCTREAKRKFDEQDKQRKAAADAAAKMSTAIPASETAVTENGMLPAEIEAAVPLRAGPATKVMRAGVRFMDAKTQLVLDTLNIYLADPTHPHHEWALKFIAERMLPRKLFESLGAKAAGIDAGEGGNKPSVTIIVQPATIPQPGEPPVVRVVDGEAVRVDDERSEDGSERKAG